MMTPKQKTQRQGVLAEAHHSFEKKLNVHAFFKTQDHAMGEGLVQDTFMKTWSYLAKGGKIDVMKSFLYHILNNLIVDEYRKHKTTSLDNLMEKGFQPKEPHANRLFSDIDGATALRLIEHLPEPYKKVIRMRFIQDLSLQEMSLITGKSKNTMAVQVHRGLEKLKLLYNPT